MGIVYLAGIQVGFLWWYGPMAQLGSEPLAGNPHYSHGKAVSQNLTHTLLDEFVRKITIRMTMSLDLLVYSYGCVTEWVNPSVLTWVTLMEFYSIST